MESFRTHPNPISHTEIAASAYRAYAASTGNKNYQGNPMPAFDELPNAIQTAWEAASRQVVFVSEGTEHDEQKWQGWRRPQDDGSALPTL